MRHTASCLMLIAAFAVALPLSAATPLDLPAVPAMPSDAGLDRYPVMSGPLSTSDLATYRLVAARLPNDMLALNWNKRMGSFEYNSILAGSLVLVSQDGVVRYKASCGNRVVPINWPYRLQSGEWMRIEPPTPKPPCGGCVPVPGPKPNPPVVRPPNPGPKPDPAQAEPTPRVFDPLPNRVLRRFLEWFFFAPAK